MNKKDDDNSPATPKPRYPSRIPVHDPVLRPEEVAVVFGVSLSWVITHADELGGFRLGKHLLRFSWSRLAAIMGATAVATEK